jgi:hypothetical protein
MPACWLLFTEEKGPDAMSGRQHSDKTHRWCGFYLFIAWQVEVQ